MINVERLERMMEAQRETAESQVVRFKLYGQQIDLNISPLHKDNIGFYTRSPMGYISRDFERVGTPIDFELGEKMLPIEDQILENFQMYLDRTNLRPDEVQESTLTFICSNAEEIARLETDMGLVPRALPHEGLILQFYSGRESRE
jgi:hypothetical protein